MGMVRDAIKAVETQQSTTAKEVESSLHLLQELADAKLAQMIDKTDKRIKEADATHEIPPGYKMFEVSEMRVLSSSGPAKGIDEAVSALLANAEENWRKAVSDIVATGANILLGQASGGAREKSYYVIALDGHAATATSEETYVPVRIDYCAWVYDLRSSGIVDEATHAMAYHARKSIVDFESCPSTSQMELSLKDIGTPSALRRQIIDMVERDREKKQPGNLLAYTRAAAPEEMRNLVRAL